MKQILVATDFSSSASNAMAYALSMAKILKMEVVAIHAIHPTEGINNSTYNAIFIESYYKNKREALKEWTEKIAKKEGFLDIKIESLCEVGFLKTVISKYIKEKPIELLVMGITGSTGISGIVGSNASMVVTRMRIPTLIVPMESNFPSAPIVTLATDYQTKLSAKDVNALNEMLKASATKKMQVLYVAEKSDDLHIQTGEKRIRELLPHTEIEFNYIRDNSAPNGIMDFIKNNHTDILCLVKHHHNIIYRLFTSSTVNQVMNRSVKAILVLHE
ncbi:universal stress protein [Pedobacter fastidiosus]|uniref:Universal stress protein n=1 Tax=Pedobacter fastidiosus TaxID=2765361 RepID=A0ABR7KS28_9SPHI|nr:universal stress protein [Pedobacter fastidiosus]MBC6110892.1 universal stress protein [Pedobacter fastidiosus]